MGTELSTHKADVHALAAHAPWLDDDTAALVEDLIAVVASARPDLVVAILYGSVARHEERLLDDPYPSDVDLLLVFDSDDPEFSIKHARAIIPLLGQALDRHLNAPREVQVLFSSRGMREWDPTFVANVARDGKILFQRKDAGGSARSILEIQGLGKHLWDGIDAQAYVDHERDSWDD
jgi:predicted nucleotidyltransferase